MRTLLVLALPLLALSLAGCAQVDAAKEQLDDARREVDELRARYDRVSSWSVVRQEVLDLNVTTRVDEDYHLRFDVNATREGIAIPRENLTALPPIAVRVDGAGWVLCDPLSCAIPLESGFEIEARAAPDALDACVVRLSPDAAPCSFRIEGARGWATTAIGDATA